MGRARNPILIALGAVILAAALPARAGTLTFTWSGATFNDGGTLSGTFTATYDDATDEMTSLVSADIVTGNGASDGFPGMDYVYAVPGKTDTVYFLGFDAQQALGAPANELVLSTDSSMAFYGQSLYLDWQGTNPTGLYVGNVPGQYTSENTPYYGIVRSLNEEGGSAGVASTPEPGSLLLVGAGFVGFGWRRRRR